MVDITDSWLMLKIERTLTATGETSVRHEGYIGPDVEHLAPKWATEREAALNGYFPAEMCTHRVSVVRVKVMEEL